MSRTNSDGQQLNVSQRIERDRLDDLSDARRHVREARREARLWIVQGHDPADAGAYLLAAVKSLLTELHPYRDAAPDYWSGEQYDAPLGFIAVAPPDRDRDIWERDLRDHSDHGPYEQLEPVVFARVDGLDDVLELPARCTHTFQYSEQPRNMPLVAYSAEAEVGPSIRLLARCIREATEFAAEIGLDLALEENNEWEV